MKIHAKSIIGNVGEGGLGGESLDGVLWFPLWGETCYWLKAVVSLKGGRERMVVHLGWVEK